VDCSVRFAYNELLKLPPGASISSGAYKIHGISTKQVRARGVDTAAALRAFHRRCKGVRDRGGVIAGHNCGFDLRALDRTAFAHHVADTPDAPLLTPESVFCTMTHSRSFSPLLDKRGRKKPFKNEELYTYFYGKPPTWAKLHDALADVLVTTANFVAGSKTGWKAAVPPSSSSSSPP
jgi:DNA polymerase III epsilon subunit-like protein